MNTTLTRIRLGILEAHDMLELPDEPLSGMDSTHQLALRMLVEAAAMLRNYQELNQA